jgi:transcription antitermination protein NusB
MTIDASVQNQNTLARDAAVQFLYQCEAEKIYYFTPNHFDVFISHYHVDARVKPYTQHLAQIVLEQLPKLDELISQSSKNWSVSRMAITDRVILRLCVAELLEKKEPPKAVMNEAIDLAKKYGTEHSGSFVNGIIDAIYETIKSK